MDASDIVSRLAEVAQELRQDSGSLDGVQVSAGFLLYDICVSLGLSDEQIKQVLAGDALAVLQAVG